uniref:C-type lectin domain-containing protein n=1 Tax=Monopterus albus TaxID=43700 RepID=A0A3Q3JET2_MONAL
MSVFLMLDIYILGFSPFFPDPGHKRCSDGWLTFGQSCFYLSTYRLNWDKSQRNCTSRGGSLAVITSQEGEGFHWIGLRKRESTWAWVNGTVLQKR